MNVDFPHSKQQKKFNSIQRIFFGMTLRDMETIHYEVYSLTGKLRAKSFSPIGDVC